MGEGGFGLWLTGDDRAARRGEILGVAASSAAVPVNAWPTRPEPLVRTMQAGSVLRTLEVPDSLLVAKP